MRERWGGGGGLGEGENMKEEAEKEEFQAKRATIIPLKVNLNATSIR